MSGSEGSRPPVVIQLSGPAAFGLCVPGFISMAGKGGFVVWVEGISGRRVVRLEQLGRRIHRTSSVDGEPPAHHMVRSRNRACPARGGRCRCSTGPAASRRALEPGCLSSFSLFGIEPHGIWTVKGSVEPRAFVLVSYAAGADPVAVVRRYMQSPEFAGEIKGWDPSNIVSVESTFLEPTVTSRLS